MSIPPKRTLQQNGQSPPPPLLPPGYYERALQHAHQAAHKYHKYLAAHDAPLAGTVGGIPAARVGEHRLEQPRASDHHARIADPQMSHIRARGERGQ